MAVDFNKTARQLFCFSLFLESLLQSDEFIRENGLFPIWRYASGLKLQELIRSLRYVGHLRRIERGIDRIANERIQFLHLRIGKMLAMKIFNRITHDHRDVLRHVLLRLMIVFASHPRIIEI